MPYQEMGSLLPQVISELYPPAAAWVKNHQGLLTLLGMFVPSIVVRLSEVVINDYKAKWDRRVRRWLRKRRK